MANIPANSLKFPGLSDTYQFNKVTNNAPAYDSTKTYAVGDLCSKDNVVYECNTAITTAEAWTAGHWTAKSLGEVLSSVKQDIKDVDGIKLTYTLTAGKAIIYNTGAVGNNSSMSITDYILIDGYSAVKYRRIGLAGSGSQGIAFYDASKTYVSGRGSKTNNGSIAYISDDTFEVPSNAKYVRFTTLTDTQAKGEFYAYGFIPLINRQNDERTLSE